MYSFTLGTDVLVDVTIDSLVLFCQMLMHFSAQLWRRGHSFGIVGIALTSSHFGVVGRFSGVIVWKWLYGLPLVTCSSVMVTSRYTPFRHNYSSGTRRTFPALFLVSQNLESVKKFRREPLAIWPNCVFVLDTEFTPITSVLCTRDRDHVRTQSQHLNYIFESLESCLFEN